MVSVASSDMFPLYYMAKVGKGVIETKKHQEAVLALAASRVKMWGLEFKIRHADISKAKRARKPSGVFVRNDQLQQGSSS